MGNNDANESALNRIQREAADWVARQDHGFTPEEQDGFFEWLAEDPRHSEQYSLRRAMWKDLDILIEWRPEHSTEPNADLLAASPAAKIIRWAGIISALAAVFVFGLIINSFWRSPDNPEAIHLSSSEGAPFYEYHVMEDGSIIELNRGTQLSVSFNQEKRLINLMSGEAHFTVAKNPERPFIVQARGTAVEARGTAFNVSLNSEEIEVLVTEGRVLFEAFTRLDSGNAPDTLREISHELVAGQRTLYSLDSENSVILIEEFSPEQISQRLSWMNEAMEFTATPLSEVILEFNRRNHTQLVIKDAAVANRIITATLRPNNLDSFLEMLELTLGIRARKEGEFKVVLYGGN